MDFSTIQSIAIPDGDVIKIEANGSTIWELLASYKNWAKNAIDTDGSLYNGCGYMEDYRMSSSGGTSALSGAIHSGFVPFVYGDVIRATGSSTSNVGQSGNYFALYDESFTLLKVITMSNAGGTKYYSATYEVQDSGFYMITLDTSKAGEYALENVQNAKYFRISFGKCEPADFIITVNEEIT